MNQEQTNKRRQWLEVAAVLARWLVGALFIYMGLKKAVHPGEFLKLVRQYDMVSSSLVLNSIAAALPWFEVFCGLLLLAGVAIRGAAVVLIAMLVPFTLIVLKRALAIAAAKHMAFCLVKFDCGCGAGEVFICNKLLENSLLILVAAWFISGAGQKLALRFKLLPSSPAAAVRST